MWPLKTGLVQGEMPPEENNKNKEKTNGISSFYETAA
jgi:hypothetical protein